MRRVGEVAMNSLTAAIAVLALLFGGKRIHDEFFPSVPRAFRVIPDWEKYAAIGHRIGTEQAIVTIVEFADFECPFCQQAAATLKDIRIEHQDDVAVVYRHFPLPIHQYAIPAARAAECAAADGKFVEFHDILFDEADSLGARPWTSLAAAAGVSDTAKFASCLDDEATMVAIERDLAAGGDLGVDGTPVFLINERKFVGFPGPEALKGYVRDALERAGVRN